MIALVLCENLTVSLSQFSPSKVKRCATLTTAGSSVYSGLSSPFSKHPHDTFPFEATDLLQTSVEEDAEIITTTVVHLSGGKEDPDRLKSVLVLHHDTELGEI